MDGAHKQSIQLNNRLYDPTQIIHDPMKAGRGGWNIQACNKHATNSVQAARNKPAD